MYKFSVVTVCYNAEKEIEKTIRSVVEQDSMDYEYIVIDGKSSDDTINIIKEHVPSFERKNVACRLVSEKDDGIYDAMNKACNLAKGEWIIFLNAGDYFASKEVLKNVQRQMQNSSAEILYGNVLERDGNFLRLAKPEPLNKIVEGMPFCHQSVFVKKQLLQDHPFNVRYPIGADYDLFLYLFEEKREFEYIDIVISVFIYGGISTQDAGYKMRLEKIKVQYEHQIINAQQVANMRKKLEIEHQKYRIKQMLKTIIPTYLIEIRRNKKKIEEGWYKN